MTKYATKAPKGARKLGEVLKGAVDEVCKYSKEGEGVDLLRQCLRKVFARTLGDRDFSLFETVTAATFAFCGRYIFTSYGNNGLWSW